MKGSESFVVFCINIWSEKSLLLLWQYKIKDLIAKKINNQLVYIEM